MITGAAVGLALLAVMAGGLGLLLHSEASALRASRVLQYGLAIAARLARRASPASVAGSLPGFRDRASVLLAARGWRITTATVASHLTLWLVLLACLRAVSLSQARLPWQTSLAAFSVIRLLTAVTYLPSIPLGALACLTWRYAPALISARPRRLPGGLASR
jgi:hypothetical protein